ncbi:baseplate assembly protein [Mergibacter septicus]|uniref:phage baseplate assembly protein V n=1 Tax=Mergibacter septicus TaxID=221402 RepID=UPI00117931FB|nr:phage baseplate assembly protein V [Mergibacter septicus]AWX14277.1 baseplate assembly protein [Mergibacter septicus]
MNLLHKKIKGIAKNVGETIRNVFRGKINLVKSTGNIQTVQISALADETLTDVEFMQQFGFTSVPPAGTEAVIVPVGGKTTHSIVIATENGSFRVKALKNGEVAIYDKSGSTIILKEGRVIEVDCDSYNVKCQQFNVNTDGFTVNASSSADFTTPQLTTSQVLTANGQINGNSGIAVQGGNGAVFSGNIEQQGGNIITSGSVNAQDDVVANNISLKNHLHQGDSGGTTGQPQ